MKKKNRMATWSHHVDMRAMKTWTRKFENTSAAPCPSPHHLLVKVWVQPVSIHAWAGQESVAGTHTYMQTHAHILCSHEKGNLVLCNSMDRSLGHCAIWCNSDTKTSVNDPNDMWKKKKTLTIPPPYPILLNFRFTEHIGREQRSGWRSNIVQRYKLLVIQ